MTVILPQFHHCNCEMCEWPNFGTLFKFPCIVRIYAWFFMHCRNHYSDSHANHVIIIFSAVGPSRYFLIFPTEYRLKLILLHNLAMCASRQHVESNITPKFLGGSSLGEIDWSPTLIDISDILLSSSRVVMIRSSVLSSFNFKKLSFIQIRMSATQASIRDIASHLDITSDGLNAI